ncbi:alpha/beta fold hydrolase [Neobacillus niacini]|uniref:alpha/beta fold hydrolase n=1 Tax=Neobacillus niacini TaxID=86668 RepID=UPI0005EDF332|nr:alpha/beta hydrolase [Neobacillus niacini]
MNEAVVSQIKMPFLRMGSGEPLVLLHGLSECKEGWFKQFELANQYDLIIPDFRGHGSNSTLEGISIKNYASDVLALLDFLNIESAHICGFSMGGVVAQELYLQAPERCKSLVFACTTPYFFDVIGKIVGKLFKARSSILSAEHRKIIVERSCFYSWNTENFQDLEKSLRPNKEGMFKAIDALSEVDYRFSLSKIQVPTLVIGARYDMLIPLWIPLYMHKQIPSSEFVILNKAGHIAKLEAATEFNQKLLQFLRKHTNVPKVS